MRQMVKSIGFYRTLRLAVCLIILGCATLTIADDILLTEQEAAALIHDHVEGKVLDVKSDDQNGRQVYLIKVITPDSRVLIVQVDAETGQLLP